MKKVQFTLLLANNCNNDLQSYGVVFHNIEMVKNDPIAKKRLDKFYEESNNSFATYTLEEDQKEEKTTCFLFLSENSPVSKNIEVCDGKPGYIECFISKIGNKIVDILFQESTSFAIQ